MYIAFLDLFFKYVKNVHVVKYIAKWAKIDFFSYIVKNVHYLYDSYTAQLPGSVALVDCLACNIGNTRT